MQNPFARKRVKKTEVDTQETLQETSPVTRSRRSSRTERSNSSHSSHVPGLTASEQIKLKRLVERKSQKMLAEIAKDLKMTTEECKAHVENEGLLLLHPSDYILIPKCVA